jgi:hypothetical protein
MAKLDVVDLVGLTFVASSGNCCITRLIGEYGLRINWQHMESEQDIAELERWLIKRLNLKPESVTVHNLRKERGEPDYDQREQAVYREYVETERIPKAFTDYTDLRQPAPPKATSGARPSADGRRKAKAKTGKETRV